MQNINDIEIKNLSLFDKKLKNSKPIKIDFLTGDISKRLKNFNNEDIIKAIGKRKNNLKILDTTCGFGRDSMLFAAAGFDVLSLERNPIIFEMLLNAINNYKEKNPKINIEIKNIDSIDFLKNSTEYFDIIYIDPMFPHTNKSRLVKKEMIILRKIVGDDEDSNILFNLALEKTKDKVIIKRPIKSDFINNKKPNYQILGRINRFDVYKK